MLNTIDRLRTVRILSWCVLWTVVVLLLRIPPYIDRVFARDTVGHSYVPIGILGPVVAGLIATTLLAALIAPKKRALLLLPALSLFLIGGAAGAWMLIPKEPFGGRLTVPPPVNVYLAILFCAPLFGLTLAGRRTLERIGVLLLAVGAVVLFERAWSSYSLIVWESGLLEVELSLLPWKIPCAAVLAGVAALTTACERLGAQPRSATRALAAALPVVAAGLLLIPYRYPRIWTPADIGTIHSARLYPTGDLILQVSPPGESPVAAPALLMQRNGEHVLRCPFRRPVASFSGSEPWLRPRGPIQFPRVALMIEASFWGFIRERPRSLAIGDTRTGVMKTVCEERWAGWQIGRMCQRATTGPGLSWAVAAFDETSASVYGQLPSGSRFELLLPNAASLLWFSSEYLQIVWLQPLDRSRPFTGTPHLERIELATGKVTSAAIPIGMTTGGPNFHLDPRGSGFVAQVAAPIPKEPGPLFFVRADGTVTPLGTSPELPPLILWRPGRTPLVFDMREMSSAFALQSHQEFFIRDLADVSGHVYALAKPLNDNTLDDLYEMDPTLTHASPIARNVRDTQWLSDSIVYVTTSDDGDRVVRKWAASGKEEMLLKTR